MKYIFAFIVLVMMAAVALAQDVGTKSTAAPDKQASPDAVSERIKALEAQLAAVQTELARLKADVNVAAQVAGPTKAASKGGKLAIDAGPVRITPYGTLFFNAFSNSSGTNNADVPLWATTSSGGNTSASVRQTRLGVRVEGARVGSANLKAVVEADFFGGFPAIGVGENFGVVRLRLANARLDWEKTSVVVGQDWMVFAPNSPTSIAAAAIPQMAAAGNPWARLPQIRVERRFGKNFTVQGAVLSPATGDFPSGVNAPFLLQPGTGASSKVPFFQGRVAFSDSNWLGTKKTGSVGLSGHFGRSRVTVGSSASTIESVGVALDWNFPIAKRVQLTGESFLGRNLAGFQAGIFQGYNTDFAFRNGSIVTPGGIRAIGSYGGWTQVGWTLPVLQDKLTAYASIGIDDPRDEDLRTVSGLNFRSRNLVYAFDLIHKFTPQFQVGAEFRRFTTRELLTGSRDANHINLGASYSF